MRSVAALKAAYAAAALLFTWLLSRMLVEVLRAQADATRIALAAVPLGAVAIAVAWLGWTLGKRLGLSRSSAAALAMGSVMAGVNIAVLAWAMFTRPPGARPPA